MTDALYLIAHKVRGEPAFDIAQHLTCPKCNATDDHCTACDGVGHWWVIPTSGHRAYPYWNQRLDSIEFEGNGNYCLTSELAAVPPDLRDHYAVEQEIAINLMHALGLNKPPTPTAPIVRRF